MALRQSLDPFRPVELAPLRAQCRDGVTLAPDLDAQSGEPLGHYGRVELDFVDVGGRKDEGGDHQEMEQTQHRHAPFTTSASAGSRGTASV
jgi:hypothetical protein